MHDDITEFLDREKRGDDADEPSSTYKGRVTGMKKFDAWLDATGHDPRACGQFEFEEFVGWMDVSDPTKYTYLTQVWAFYRYLDKRGEDVEIPDKEQIVTDAGVNLDEAEREKHVPKSRCSLSQDEMSTMIDHASEPEFKNGLIMRILGSTGVRPKGLRDLKVSDIDDDFRWMEARSSKTNSRRRIPIPDALAQSLRLWLEHGYRAACGGAEQSDYLIPGDRVPQLGSRPINRAVSNAAEAAGLQEVVYEDAAGNPRYRITPYSFRYGYGNHMKNHVDPERLQQLMGHKSVETTLKYYNSASEDELEAAGAVAPDP